MSIILVELLVRVHLTLETMHVVFFGDQYICKWWKYYGKTVMFIKTNFSLRKDKASHIDFWKKKIVPLYKKQPWSLEDESIPNRVQAITEIMVRCKRTYLRVAAVCVGTLYLIYIFGMLEKTSRIVRTDAKDLNGTSNTSLHICPMFSPYLSKYRRTYNDLFILWKVFNFISKSVNLYNFNNQIDQDQALYSASDWLQSARKS